MEFIETINPVANLRIPLLVKQIISQFHNLPAEVIQCPSLCFSRNILQQYRSLHISNQTYIGKKL
jgi:hypothetical protein